MCCVLTISLERRKHLSGLDSSSKGYNLFSRATPPTLTLWDEHTSIAQCSTKCCVKQPARARIKASSFFFFFSFFWLREVRRRHAPSLSLCRCLFACRREKMALNATTSLQNRLDSLPTDKSTSLSTHGSHSDTQSSPQKTPME